MKKTAQAVINEFFDALQCTQDDKAKPLQEKLTECLQVKHVPTSDLPLGNAVPIETLMESSYGIFEEHHKAVAPKPLDMAHVSKELQRIFKQKQSNEFLICFGSVADKLQRIVHIHVQHFFMADEKHVRSLPDLHNVKSLNIRASLHVNEMETKHNTVDLYNKDACVQALVLSVDEQLRIFLSTNTARMSNCAAPVHLGFVKDEAQVPKVHKKVLVEKYHELIRNDPSFYNPLQLEEAVQHYQLPERQSFFVPKRTFESQDYYLSIRKVQNRQFGVENVLCGVQYSKKNNYEKALSYYNRALDLDPTLADAYVGKGAVYYNQGKFKDAKAEYQKGLECEPAHQTATAYLAKAQAKLDAANAEQKKQTNSHHKTSSSSSDHEIKHKSKDHRKSSNHDSKKKDDSSKRKKRRRSSSYSTSDSDYESSSKRRRRSSYSPSRRRSRSKSPSKSSK